MDRVRTGSIGQGKEQGYRNGGTQTEGQGQTRTKGGTQRQIEEIELREEQEQGDRDKDRHRDMDKQGQETETVADGQKEILMHSTVRCHSTSGTIGKHPADLCFSLTKSIAQVWDITSKHS